MSRMTDHFLGDRPYPGSPGFKEPTTSRDAAAAVAASASIVRERVFQAFLVAGERGLTADEAGAAVGAGPLSARPRVTELAKAGRIVPTGERRRNESRLSAKVWRAVR